MKKILLLNLLLAMLLGATSVWAADGDIFTAPVTVIQNGETSQEEMRFQVLSESAKTCETYGTYDEISDVVTPAFNYRTEGDVIIPNTVNGYIVTGIGDYSFCRCSMGHIMLPESINYVGKLAFNECFSLLEIDLPSKVSTIGVEAFRRCENLRHATIYCKEIPFNCFAYCYNLSSVTIKSPVTSVGVEAFLCCYRLESITFPAGLEYIDRKAISDCKNLKSVILTCSRINASAFSGSCERLKEVIITSETPPTITVPSSSGWTEAALFSGVPSNAVLIVPDRTKYLQEPWTSSFSEIKSFLPTNEKTYAFYNLGVSGWGWPVYTNDPNKVLNFKVDGEPKAPTFHGTDLIVSDDPKQIPLEVSFLLKTDEGIQPYIIHYDLFDYGFSIDGKAMTSRDFYNVPGVVSGKAYIKDEFVLGGENHLHWKKEPTLVLDNATLEWDGNNYGIYNNNNYYFTIKVIGDCSITSKNDAALELAPVTRTTIEGGGTLNILSKYCCIESFALTELTIQDNTKIIGRSTDGRGYYEGDAAKLEIKDGAVFAVNSKYEPLYLDKDKPVFGEGIDIRYPEGAYFSGTYNNLYYADGTEVKNDWVVIGPENLTKGLGFFINDKEMTRMDMHDLLDDVPGVVSGSAYIEENEYGVPVLVLDNATLGWNDASNALNLHSGDLTIKVLGDCVINASDHTGLSLSGNTTVTGGGTLTINSKWAAIENWEDTRFTVNGNTTLIAYSSDSYGYCDEGYDYEQTKSWFTIEGGGLFAAFGKYGPISFNNDRSIHFDSYTDVRYPVGGYLSGNYVYDADGTEVTNDWVVIGPDTQATKDLITGVASPKSSPEGNDFIYNLAGQRLSKPQKGINIVGGKKVLIE